MALRDAYSQNDALLVVCGQEWLSSAVIAREVEAGAWVCGWRPTPDNTSHGSGASQRPPRPPRYRLVNTDTRIIYATNRTRITHDARHPNTHIITVRMSLSKYNRRQKSHKTPDGRRGETHVVSTRVTGYANTV